MISFLTVSNSKISRDYDATKYDESSAGLITSARFGQASVRKAVYEFSAYNSFGYGRTEFKASVFGGTTATMDYNYKNISFAVSKDRKSLFIYSLGLPEPNTTLNIHHVTESAIKRVSVIGSGSELNWSKTDGVLAITTPATSEMDELAIVFKVEFE